MSDNPQTTILTIDDEEAIRTSFVRYLEECDYRMLAAENGRIGIEVFRREKPDLLLVDLRMPEVDGLEVLATVRRESPDTPIIIVSGAGKLGDAVEALRLGAWDYLVKPIYEMSMLRHAIEKALERARLITENRHYQEHLEEMVKQRTAQLEEANIELKETRLQIIRRLGKAAEYKDNETGRHVIRVGLYSEILAKTLGLDEETVELIHHASPMHDIGKVGVADSILNKPSCLDTDEWQLMKKHCPRGLEILHPLSEEEMQLYRRHTEIGQDILAERRTPLLIMATNIANCHHEKWDGSGYPQGLQGEDIPFEARIVAVADVYDALASKRPYKEPLPHEECAEIIVESSGSHFDPQVVEAFKQCSAQFHEITKEWGD